MYFFPPLTALIIWLEEEAEHEHEQKHRQTERETERERETEGERETERDRERDRERQRDRESEKLRGKGHLVKDFLVEAPRQELLMIENLEALMLVPRALRIGGDIQW
jgi:hypothetical protein